MRICSSSRDVRKPSSSPARDSASDESSDGHEIVEVGARAQQQGCEESADSDSGEHRAEQEGGGEHGGRVADPDAVDDLVFEALVELLANIEVVGAEAVAV